MKTKGRRQSTNVIKSTPGKAPPAGMSLPVATPRNNRSNVFDKFLSGMDRHDKQAKIRAYARSLATKKK